MAQGGWVGPVTLPDAVMPSVVPSIALRAGHGVLVMWHDEYEVMFPSSDMVSMG